MDIEKLTKSQIVLLTLLVSFVTSIATGIVTVSLMDEAPSVIPHTVNRVVERTVERVVPAESQPATVVTQEKTVVVQESDLIAQAVERVSPSVVRVHESARAVREDTNTESGSGAGTAASAAATSTSATSTPALGEFIARGLLVSPNALLVGAALPAEGTYHIATVAGEVPGRVIQSDSERGISLMQFGADGNPGINSASMSTNALTLGQRVIALTGTSGARVVNGIISSINPDEDAAGNAVQGTFEADINVAALVPGAILTNTDGAVVGMYTGDVTNIVPARLLLETLNALQKSSDEQMRATSTPQSAT